MNKINSYSTILTLHWEVLRKRLCHLKWNYFDFYLLLDWLQSFNVH